MAHQTDRGTSRPDPALGRQDYGHVATYYGEDHHHKPTKAIIGVAILVVLSFLTYEFKGKSADMHSSDADQKPIHRTMASSSH
jgi:hypothetical protein